MNQLIRASAVAGVCALLLLVPVIFWDYVLAPGNVLEHTNPAIIVMVTVLYQTFGVMYAIFAYRFVPLGVKRESALLVLGASALSFSWALSELIAIPVLFHVGIVFATLTDMPLIIVRAASVSFFGIAMLASKEDGERLTLWLSVAALTVGAGTIAELVNASWSDITDIPFLITGTIMLWNASGLG